MSSPSLSHQAHERIKRKIVSLELAPGSVIDEGVLREELGLGRTPIREALQRLSQERLVVIVPRRGTFVTEIGITDLQELFEVRVVLEGLAARLAAVRGSAGHWTRMEETLSAMDAAGADYGTLIAIDESCHEIIYEAAGNDFLRDTLVTLYALSLRLWYFFLERIGRMEHAVAEHTAVLEALVDGDGGLASRLMEKHIRAFQEQIGSVMLATPMYKDEI
jgi:DNA-binding GntR family transcriptional regulator